MIHVFDLLVRSESGIFFVIGLIIAVIITGHVLLTKPSVTAAAGWIALVLFSPFFGGFAYFALGINRVRRRARRLRRRGRPHSKSERESWEMPAEEANIWALSRAIGRISARRVEPGNIIEILQNGDQAYPAMLDAIAAAKSSIGLSSYIMRADTAGHRFVDALQAAQARGVVVQVIVDGVGSGWIHSPAYAALKHAKVPVVRFMHAFMPWNMPFLNLRTHKKILVIDGTIGFTGGINIADQNVLADRPENPVQDTHFRLTGPVVAQLVEAFASDWHFVTQQRLDGPAWFPELSPAANGAGAPARVVTAGPDQDLEKVEFVVLEALACAKESIQVMTPYFLPDERLVTALSLAAMRGVTVDIILPERSDHRWIDYALRANVLPLLRDGVRIWRSPQPFRHSKVMIIDANWCLIGSSNWDMRSFRLNFELCVEFYDRALATALVEMLERCKGPPLEIGDILRRRLPIRLRDAAVRLFLPYL